MVKVQLYNTNTSCLAYKTLMLLRVLLMFWISKAKDTVTTTHHTTRLNTPQGNISVIVRLFSALCCTDIASYSSLFEHYNIDIDPNAPITSKGFRV